MVFVIHSTGSLGMPGLNEGRNRWITISRLSQPIKTRACLVAEGDQLLDFQWDWLENEREESKLLGILTKQMQFKVRKLWEPFGT